MTFLVVKNMHIMRMLFKYVISGRFSLLNYLKFERKLIRIFLKNGDILLKPFYLFELCLEQM